MTELTCAVCDNPIVSGERRYPQYRPTGSVVVHERCEPAGHIPKRTDVPAYSFAFVLGEGVPNVFCMSLGSWEQLDGDIKRVGDVDIVDGEFVIETPSTVLYCDALRSSGETESPTTPPRESDVLGDLEKALVPMLGPDTSQAVHPTLLAEEWLTDPKDAEIGDVLLGVDGNTTKIHDWYAVGEHVFFKTDAGSMDADAIHETPDVVVVPGGEA